jgi:small-conductance mechanosensitive channel
MAGEVPLEELQKDVQAVTWQQGLVSLGILVGAVVVAKLAGRLVRWAFSKEVRGPAFAFSKLLTYGLQFAGVVSALWALGIPLASLMLTSGALLVGIGFSLQHVARDGIAGIVILVERTIRKNDFVEFSGTTGTVQEIGIRATQLLTPEGTMLVVPNHLLVTSEVTNHSHPLERSRVSVEIPADLGESVDEVREALLSAADGRPDVLSEPPPMARLAAIEPAGFRFLLIVWVKEAVAVLRVASELRYAAARVFAERGIRFPITTLALEPPGGRDRENGAAERPGSGPAH